MHSSALEAVAEAADDAGREQREVARRARGMQRRRDRGWSWARVLDAERPPGILALSRSGTRHAGQALATLAGVLARGLSSEGESRRQVARRLGVTHQRVSAMLANARSGTSPSG